MRTAISSSNSMTILIIKHKLATTRMSDSSSSFPWPSSEATLSLHASPQYSIVHRDRTERDFQKRPCQRYMYMDCVSTSNTNMYTYSANIESSHTKHDTHMKTRGSRVIFAADFKFLLALNCWIDTAVVSWYCGYNFQITYFFRWIP